MSLSAFDGLLWLALMLAALTLLQRFLHREIQTVFLLLTRDTNITIILFALIFIPGVFLHELSHFLMAKILRVATGGFSLIPEPLDGGRLRMGYVETAESDPLRDSLIGAAPILFGTLFLAWVAVARLHLVVMWDTFRNAQWTLFGMGLQTLPAQPDFWLWFYLAFAVSSTMMPSDSDRHSWTPLLLIVGALLALFLLAGAGAWMVENLAPPLNAFLRGVALVLLFSNLVHVLLIPPFLFFHRLLTKLTGLDVGE
ncbi:MAG: hypothetical protein OHK0031_16000 [Anaerolineales bacterium]